MHFSYKVSRLTAAGCFVIIAACGGRGTTVPLLTDPGYEFTAKARNVILFIGDGMGEGPRTAARWVKVGPAGKLAMDDMPASGLSRTWNLDGEVTDSAAGATAIATGHKTANGIVSMSPQRDVLPTILEEAKALGKATGLVTNTRLTDCTVAAFAAHVLSRSMNDAIAVQMVNADVDVLLGGGENKFLPAAEIGCYPGEGEREDSRNLIHEAQALGYAHICQPFELANIDPALFTRLLGVFADGAIPLSVAPTLADMTKKALDLLSRDPDGFFLMVEDGRIDKAGHSQDAEAMIQGTLELDDAISVAKAFATANLEETLIIVTADHDTGGMTVNTTLGETAGQGPFYTPDGTSFRVLFSTSRHTAQDVPVTAQGPSADAIQGGFENTYLHKVMVRALQ